MCKPMILPQPFSNPTSSLQTLLSHPFELDNVPFSTCLGEMIESCKKMQEVNPEGRIRCAAKSFHYCIGRVQRNDPMQARKSMFECIKKYELKRVDLEDCLNG